MNTQKQLKASLKFLGCTKIKFESDSHHPQHNRATFEHPDLGTLTVYQHRGGESWFSLYGGNIWWSGKSVGAEYLNENLCLGNTRELGMTALFQVEFDLAMGLEVPGLENLYE